MAVLTAAEVLTWAIQIEENGEVFYNSVASKTSDPELQALFEDLAAQEQMHRRTFQRLLEQTPTHEVLIADEEEYDAYLQATLTHALFGGTDKGLRLAEQASDRVTALQGAMGFEKDTLLFFYDLRDLVGQGQRDSIARLIREEKAHLRRLARVSQK